MAAYVYVLRSERNGRYYIGYSADLATRLATHNAGHVKATRNLRPWVLVYSEAHADETSARKREWSLKASKSRRLIERLIASV
jgi:putative endonuclease